MTRKVMPVRITLTDDTGSTHEQQFEPYDGIEQETFNYECLGRMFAMITSGYTNSLDHDSELWTSEWAQPEVTMLPIVAWTFTLLD